MKYDERYIYLLAYQKGFANGRKADVYPHRHHAQDGQHLLRKLSACALTDPVDFVLAIDGRDNSRLLVQERYEVLRAMFYHETHDADAYLDPPDADTPLFKPIDLMLQTATPLLTGNWQASSETYETGDLAYGNANPAAPDYDSLGGLHLRGRLCGAEAPLAASELFRPLAHDHPRRLL